MDLPIEMLLKRLRNELKASAGYVIAAPNLKEPQNLEWPIDVVIELKQVPAYFMVGGERKVRYSHRFRMTIDKEYPQRKPVVNWLTPISHPNIMMPEDGGHMCTKLLEEWDFNSTMISFIKGVEALLITPNATSPFGTDSCTAAAEYFNKRPHNLPPIVRVPPPRVVGDS